MLIASTVQYKKNNINLGYEQVNQIRFIKPLSRSQTEVGISALTQALVSTLKKFSSYS